ncbi:CHAD domain-containing protein [Mesorhizobium tianshanense]|uniref:CHAD domain-containing protein n=1 Tax=Mesorhizobium tianshanense TaxID=39844 RepID=A0A562NC52_9HYPH|nr:CHAD domain-containing protein [Mesorhizobium tianshanense]TWI29481.1 CHAD domain-containing protein [Mesorhizobium tianshanense]
MEKLHRKVLKRGHYFKKLSPEERHKLRNALKKLRYASDFFLPLFEKTKRKRHFAKTLAGLQDQLGRYNDMAVMEELVQRIMKNKLPVTGQHAAGALLGWQAGSVNRDDAELLSAWKEFQSADLP